MKSADATSFVRLLGLGGGVGDFVFFILDVGLVEGLGVGVVVVRLGQAFRSAKVDGGGRGDS